MLFRRQAEQLVKHRYEQKITKGKEMRWWDLSLIGTGSVIGAGFFLGSALSIQRAGPSLLIVYLLGGFTAFVVFSALADMSVNDPQEGSFRVYARKAFGHSMGFMSGWMYWLAGILIVSSEIAALSIFSRFWFPTTPIGVFTAFYSLLGLAIILLGVKDFGKVESWLGLLKTSSLLVFILLGVLLLSGIITPQAPNTANFLSSAAPDKWFAHGITGTWTAMIFVLFSYGGIEVMGILSCELKNHREIGKAGRVMLISLTLVYTLALFFVFILVPWQTVNPSQSPFVTALTVFRLSFANSLLNLIIISAAFSTMVGALFAITNVMVSLAEDQNAPAKLADRNARGVPVPALKVTSAGLVIAVILSFLLPNTVYEYLTAAAGVMLILNWIIILSSQLRNRPNYMENSPRLNMFGYPYTSYVAIGLIIFTIIGALLSTGERIGVIISLLLA
ncbi:MAG: amino acid permease, partial [Syntrophomonas sp.]